VTAVSSTADKICTKPASVQPAATGEIPGNLNRTPVSDGYMPHKYIPTFAIEKFACSLVAFRSSCAWKEWLLPSIWTFSISALSGLLVSAQFWYILAVYSVDIQFVVVQIYSQSVD
jgi:hypothetical protein